MERDILEECAIELWAISDAPKGYELTPYINLPEDYKKYYRRLARGVISKYLSLEGK